MKKEDSIIGRILKYFHDLYLKRYAVVEENKTAENSTYSYSKNFRLDNDVSDIMTARVDLLALEFSTPYTEVMKIIAKSGFSRIPVYEKELDKIKGVLHVKDIFKHILEEKEFEWNKILREPFFVPESKDVNDLLKEFQEQKRHQAIVVDEFGSVVGIACLEDILEEIVGEISDEFDNNKPSLVTKQGNNVYYFSGKISINDFSKAINLSDDKIFDDIKGDADSLAGMLIEIQGYLPKKGESIVFENYHFTIEKADNRKVERIKLIIK